MDNNIIVFASLKEYVAAIESLGYEVEVNHSTDKYRLKNTEDGRTMLCFLGGAEIGEVIDVSKPLGNALHLHINGFDKKYKVFSTYVADGDTYYCNVVRMQEFEGKIGGFQVRVKDDNLYLRLKKYKENISKSQCKVVENTRPDKVPVSKSTNQINEKKIVNAIKKIKSIITEKFSKKTITVCSKSSK